jgi:hypothetical protein
MAIFESEFGTKPSARRIGTGAGGLFVAAFLIWGALYASGIIPWLGYAWLTRQSFGAGPFGVIGEDQAGTNFGISTFFFMSGQEVVIDYDAEIRAGSLFLYVHDLTKAGQGLGGSHFVTESGVGVWTYRIPRTGLYAITIEPSTAKGAGSGFDMSYSAWWGARWAD